MDKEVVVHIHNGIFSSVQSLSHVQLFVTPWTAAYQGPLSMGFSRQEYSIAQLNSWLVRFATTRLGPCLAKNGIKSYQCSSVAQSCPNLCDPMNRSTPGFSVHPQLTELPKLMSIESMMPSNHLILCHPLLLLPSVFPSIRVFSNESALRIRLLLEFQLQHQSLHWTPRTNLL